MLPMHEAGRFAVMRILRVFAAIWVNTTITISLMFSVPFLFAVLAAKEDPVNLTLSMMWVSSLVLGIGNGLCLGLVPFRFQKSVLRKLVVSVVIAFVVSAAFALRLITTTDSNPVVIILGLFVFSVFTIFAGFLTLISLRRLFPYETN